MFMLLILFGELCFQINIFFYLVSADNASPICDSGAQRGAPLFTLLSYKNTLIDIPTEHFLEKHLLYAPRVILRE